MNWYKKAQTNEEIKKIKNSLEYIFNKLAEDWNVKPNWDASYILNVSIEKHDSIDLKGESWFQVSHNRNSINYSENKTSVNVQRYFENEYMDQEYGFSVNVEFDYQNPAEGYLKITRKIKELS